jgi:hypothetical protein
MEIEDSIGDQNVTGRSVISCDLERVPQRGGRRMPN